MNRKMFICLLTFILLLSGCGKAESTVQEAETSRVVAESEELIPTPAQIETEVPVETVDLEDPDWVKAYQDLLQDSFMSSNRVGLQGFSLYDFDSDDSPELIINIIDSWYYIYTFCEEDVEWRGCLDYDYLSEEKLGYDTRDGKTYIYEYGYGTGSDCTTSLYELILPAEKVTETTIKWNATRREIYSAVFGNIETQDEYKTLEWEDAIAGQDTVISKDEFKAIVANFEPFVFVDITDENLEKYICRDYNSLQSAQSYKLDEENLMSYRVIPFSNIIVDDIAYWFTDEEIENLMSDMEELIQVEMTNVIVHIGKNIEYCEKVEGEIVISPEDNGGTPIVSIIFDSDQGVFDGYVDKNAVCIVTYIG